MESSIAASLFFIVAWGALASGIYFSKKSEKKLDAVTWVVADILVTTCWHVLVAAVINLLKVPVNIITIGIFDLCAGAVLWFRIYKSKERQRYEFHIGDAVFCVALLVFSVLLTKYRYGGTEFFINYLTIDPAAHFKAAMDVVNNQCVNNMFYQALTNGLLIEVFSPLLKVDYYYRIFVFSEPLFLALAGGMFYGTIKRYLNTRFMQVAGIIISFLYIGGYPLDSTEYGFVYLGMGVTLLILLVFLADTFAKDEIAKWWNIVLLSLGCLGIFECYVMFMTIIFFAVIFVVFLKQQRAGILISKDTVITCLAIFLIPCILGMVYTYFGIFGSNLTVGGALSNEGAIYRDLYSNFVPFLPFALYGFYKEVKEKKNTTTLFLLPFLVIFMIGLFLRGMAGKVSSYYYYKTYYVLWFVVMLLVIAGISYMTKETRIVTGCCFAVWLAVFGAMVFHIEEKIQGKNELFNVNIKSSAFNDIFSYNYNNLRSAGYSLDKRELYHYVYDELISKGQDMVPIASYWQDDFWYQGITNQRNDGWDVNNSAGFLEMLLNSDAEYVLVLTDSQSTVYLDNQTYFDSLERVYENAAGFVAKLE